MSAQRLGLGAAMLLVSIFAVMPIFWVTYIPASDYPFHLARIAILSLGEKSPLLGTYYQFGSWLLPNVALDAFALPLTTLLSPEMAVKLFLATMQLAFLGGCQTLHHAAFHRLSAWPLLGGLLLYNGIFLFGLFNFLFSAAFAIWAAALWLRSRPGWRRSVAAWVISIVLMWAHMGGFAVYAILIAAFQLQTNLECRSTTRLITTAKGLAWDASPFLAALLLFLLVSPGSERARDGLTYSPWLGAKPYAALFSLQSGVLWADVLVLLALAVLMLILLLTHQLVVSRRVLAAAGLLWLAFVVLPPDILGSFFADVRLVPIAALVTLLAFGTLDTKRRWPEALVISIGLGIGAVKTGVLMNVWKSDQNAIEKVVIAMQSIPSGSTLFAATAKPYLSMWLSQPGAREAWHPPLGYVATYASAYGSVFVPLTFADPHKQPMVVNEKYRAIKELQGDTPIQVPRATDLVAVAKRIDQKISAPEAPALNEVYLLAVGTDRYPALVPLDGFDAFFEGDNFVIYRHVAKN